ncbi:MAG: hypothetical protein ACLRWP_08800 [Bilophila wadsworthia]
MRALPFELQDAIERVWEEWTPTADVRGMMHFGDRSQPLSALLPDSGQIPPVRPTAECPQERRHGVHPPAISPHGPG